MEIIVAWRRSGASRMITGSFLASDGKAAESASRSRHGKIEVLS
jgi:hypothetical protein